jgi:hypothetical protein
LKSDDGDGNWDDKDNEEGSDSGSVEEVDDFTESDEDEPLSMGRQEDKYPHESAKQYFASLKKEEEEDGSVEEVSDLDSDEEEDSEETVSDEEEVDAERKAARDLFKEKLDAFKPEIEWGTNDLPTEKCFMTLRGLMHEHVFRLFEGLKVELFHKRQAAFKAG